MIRTDIHRPSAAEFDPEAYDLRFVFDNSTGEDGDPQGRKEARELTANLRAEGYRIGHGSSQQCGHCGTHIRYAALMVRQDVKQYIFVGEQCLDGRFEMTKGQFQTLREASALNRQQMAKKDRIALLIQQYPFLTEILAIDDYSQEFLTSIAGQLTAKGELSDRQLESAEKALKGYQNYQAAVAKRAADEAAAKASGALQPVPVTDKRITVQGEVRSTKLVDSMYGATLKMLVVTVDGWKTWGSVPSGIEVEVGTVVKFDAKVQVSDDDEFFSFFSRPTRASIIA